MLSPQMTFEGESAVLQIGHHRPHGRDLGGEDAPFGLIHRLVHSLRLASLAMTSVNRSRGVPTMHRLCTGRAADVQGVRSEPETNRPASGERVWMS